MWATRVNHYDRGSSLPRSIHPAGRIPTGRPVDRFDDVGLRHHRHAAEYSQARSSAGTGDNGRCTGGSRQQCSHNNPSVLAVTSKSKTPTADAGSAHAGTSRPRRSGVEPHDVVPPRRTPTTPQHPRKSSSVAPTTPRAVSRANRPASRGGCDQAHEQTPDRRARRATIHPPCGQHVQKCVIQGIVVDGKLANDSVEPPLTACRGPVTPPKVERRRSNTARSSFRRGSQITSLAAKPAHDTSGSVPVWDAHALLASRAVCPTPCALESVLARGERELPNWRKARNGKELLGTCAKILTDTARYCVDAAGGSAAKESLFILSLADGVADDKMPEWQARYVPTSVMLCQAFAMTDGIWQNQQMRIHVFGGDLKNRATRWWEPQRFMWPLPSWLEHRFLALDNSRDFIKQIFGDEQCSRVRRFDVVIIRQGLCFCDDPSKSSRAWPREVFVSLEIDGSIAGTYQLESFLHEGRPAYRRGQCLLKWVPRRGEWMICDEGGGIWAYARSDVGHPAVARGPWIVWNGVEHAQDPSFQCEIQPDQPPWQLHPSQRMCCCGIPGAAGSLVALFKRIVSVLDVQHLNSFGLLHGAWTNGTKAEVHQLHQQIEEAVQIFNEQHSDAHVATVLCRKSSTDFWLQCDGVLLFQPGSRADPFCSEGVV